jgi:hypothetical protein
MIVVCLPDGRQASGHFFVPPATRRASNSENSYEACCGVIRGTLFLSLQPIPVKAGSHIRKPWIILYYGLLNDPTF